MIVILNLRPALEGVVPHNPPIAHDAHGVVMLESVGNTINAEDGPAGSGGHSRRRDHTITGLRVKIATQDVVAKLVNGGKGMPEFDLALFRSQEGEEKS